MKSDGGLALAQLNHAGRQTPVTIWESPFSASDVQLNVLKRGAGFGVPIPLTGEQIATEVSLSFPLFLHYFHFMTINFFVEIFVLYCASICTEAECFLYLISGRRWLCMFCDSEQRLVRGTRGLTDSKQL